MTDEQLSILDVTDRPEWTYNYKFSLWDEILNYPRCISCFSLSLCLGHRFQDKWGNPGFMIRTDQNMC